ncbi:MAG: ATP synthase F1 subunit epsilon [bacterium]|nr:ATP synthase F1 subunit epsilon [Candidatus Microgenomates bacterium CPR3]MCQ3944335.1 ATP synthase F1 subunit epsilon [bacterium]RIK51482.1 MAG: ATP synthase F1 subunit epsilon [Candidatus Microgenomates bacterium]
MTNKLTLDIVTQERRLLTVEVGSVTAQTAEGEITILPNHVPLLTRLTEGLLRYKDSTGSEETVVIFGGFLEVDALGNINILADSAVRAGDLDEAKIKAAEAEAKATLADKTRELEFAEAESSLRRAYLELKALNKGSKPRHSQN